MSPLDPANPALGRAIRALREDQALTQEDLAYQAGITPGSLSRVETALSNPTFTTVERIAEALGVSLEELGAAVERAEG
jgi:transcriptional regulator with XRE-family HTH domain